MPRKTSWEPQLRSITRGYRVEPTELGINEGLIGGIVANVQVLDVEDVEVDDDLDEVLAAALDDGLAVDLADDPGEEGPISGTRTQWALMWRRNVPRNEPWLKEHPPIPATALVVTLVGIRAGTSQRLLVTYLPTPRDLANWQIPVFGRAPAKYRVFGADVEDLFKFERKNGRPLLYEDAQVFREALTKTIRAVNKSLPMSGRVTQAAVAAEIPGMTVKTLQRYVRHFGLNWHSLVESADI